MTQIKRVLSLLVLVLLLTVNAFAAEIPESFTCENLNGQQRIVKTYVLPPNADPEALKEAPFNYEGYHYIWSYTTKEEHPFTETKEVTETATVETEKDDLSVILEQLAPTMAYDDGAFTGELALDHTTLKTEVAGYDTRRTTISETKTYPGLASNDMSYVPGTTVKNGRTLKLVNVDWQVTGTALVGEDLMPAEYQAIAYYSASSSYQMATGYVTTAEYKGEVTSSGIQNITYEVVYSGSEILPVAQDIEETNTARRGLSTGGTLLLLFAILAAALLGGVLALLFLRRSNVYVYVPGNRPRDYKLVAKFRVKADDPRIDISELDQYPESTVAVEVKRPLAKKLIGKEFIVQCREGTYTYPVRQDRPGDWHEFNIETMEEVETSSGRSG